MAPTPGGGADRDAAHTFWACAFNMCKAIVGAGAHDEALASQPRERAGAAAAPCAQLCRGPRARVGPAALAGAALV